MSPNLDQHPDPGGMVLLLCAANRQPTRGQFRDRAVLVRTLGAARLRRFEARGDVVSRDGLLVVDGWEEWQEGDLTVRDRQARIRDKRAEKSRLSNGDVTPQPLPTRISPSEANGEWREANGEQGVNGAVEDKGSPRPRPVDPLVPA